MIPDYAKMRMKKSWKDNKDKIEAAIGADKYEELGTSENPMTEAAKLILKNRMTFRRALIDVEADGVDVEADGVDGDE